MNSVMVWASRMKWSVGRYFHYASMIPRGKVEGQLFLPDNQVVSVKGQGYHEQGRANSPFQQVFTYWYWTRCFIGDWTIILPVAEAPKHAFNAKMRAVLIYYKNELVADIYDISGLFIKHEILKYQTDTKSGREDIPQEAIFKIRKLGLSLTIKMSLDHELERFAFKPYNATGSQEAVWFQHLMAVEVEGRWQKKPVNLKGRGVFETMLTGAE